MAMYCSVLGFSGQYLGITVQFLGIGRPVTSCMCGLRGLATWCMAMYCSAMTRREIRDMICAPEKESQLTEPETGAVG